MTLLVMRINMLKVGDKVLHKPSYKLGVITKVGAVTYRIETDNTWFTCPQEDVEKADFSWFKGEVNKEVVKNIVDLVKKGKIKLPLPLPKKKKATEVNKLTEVEINKVIKLQDSIYDCLDSGKGKYKLLTIEEVHNIMDLLNLLLDKNYKKACNIYWSLDTATREDLPNWLEALMLKLEDENNCSL